jgi:hypothetical protein
MLWNQFIQLNHVAKLPYKDQLKEYYQYVNTVLTQQRTQQTTVQQSIGNGASFTPLQLFALGVKGVWFDASDISTMFQDSAGTIPVTAAGQSVGKWLDKSGNGNHATQTTAGARPTYQVDANGYPNVTFDGSNDYMLTSNIDLSGTARVMLGAGVNVIGSGSAAAALAFGTDISTVNGSFLFGAPGSATDHSLYVRGSSTLRAAINNVSDGADILVGLFDISQATKEAELIPRLNYTQLAGTQITWTGTDAGSGSFGNLPLYLGGYGSSLQYNGAIYQVIVRGALSSATEVVQTENWIDTKLD